MVPRSSLLTSTGFQPTRLGFQPPACESHFRIEDFLFTPSHDAHELNLHIGSLALIALASVRFAEVNVSNPLTKSKKTLSKIVWRPAQPHRGCCGEHGPAATWFQIRELP